MKKLIGAILLALACWAIPIKTWAQTASTPKTNIVAVYQDSYTSPDIIIKDNAIQLRPSRTNDDTVFQQPLSIRGKAGTHASTSVAGIYNGRNYSREEVQQLIRDYSAEDGISADLPLRIAQCESGFNQFAQNKSSSASGVYQWLNSSWTSQPASQANTVSVFDADKNVSAAVWLIAHGQTSPWKASRSCWSK